MVFSNDMIQSILEEHLWPKDIYQDGKFQCGFEELVEGITVELNVITDTERQMNGITAEEIMLTEEYEKACDELLTSKMKVMSNCRHHLTTTGLDRPGKLASTICDTCGAEVGHGS